MKPSKKQWSLICTIYQHGSYCKPGQDAVAELVAGADSSLGAFVFALQDPPRSDLHPRDLHDTISDVFWEFARQDPNGLIDRLDQIGEFRVYWALGAAKDKRSFETLITGLKSKDVYNRWAAVESLIRRKCQEAVDPLLAMLNDRSSTVKGRIVFAMKSSRMLRRTNAIPGLNRLIANKSLQKHSPGIVSAAREVLKMIKQ